MAYNCLETLDSVYHEGARCGKLTILEYFGKDLGGHRIWTCKCECGNRLEVSEWLLRRHKKPDCGCVAIAKNNLHHSKSTNVQGYVIVSGYKGHPNANQHGQIAEHRLIMSQILGRALVKGENVHHINGQRDDNRPENLELWNTSQPAGQRAVDKIAFAKMILALYEPELLK